VSLAQGGFSMTYRVFTPDPLPSGALNVYINQGGRACGRLSGAYQPFAAGEKRELVANVLTTTGLCTAQFQTFSLPAYLEEGEKIRAAVTTVVQYTFVP
jgi:hypothetical protein